MSDSPINTEQSPKDSTSDETVTDTKKTQIPPETEFRHQIWHFVSEEPVTDTKTNGHSPAAEDTKVNGNHTAVAEDSHAEIKHVDANNKPVEKRVLLEEEDEAATPAKRQKKAVPLHERLFTDLYDAVNDRHAEGGEVLDDDTKTPSIKATIESLVEARAPLGKFHAAVAGWGIDAHRICHIWPRQLQLEEIAALPL